MIHVSMVCRSGDVVDALHRRKIDFYCAQETRWKGVIAIVRRCKFFWQCCDKDTAGVCLFIAERWTDTVVNVVKSQREVHLCEAGDWKAYCKYCLRLCSSCGFEC